jgi:hypothetical protein
MKKIIVFSNIMLMLSYILLYVYILVFYIAFGKLATLDPKDLNCDIIYKVIIFLYLFAFLLIIIIPLAWVISCIVKRKIIFNHLVLFSLLNSLLFLILCYFDFGNLQSWFFD